MEWNGYKLRQALLAHDMTQTELAEILGCRQQTVSEWCCEEYVPGNAYQKILTWAFESISKKKPKK